jgi:GrpB-like predicted nucleotidyltransferase (UPF0157 family)
MPMKLLEPDQYQANAWMVFEEIRHRLHLELPNARIEHIGASSILGADSKGDIDICVIVSRGDLESAIEALRRLGYVDKQGTLRTPQLCMLVSLRSDVDLALQVIEEGSEYEFFILFRDALRMNRDLVRRYNQIKRESVHLGEEAYRNAKSRFIEQVLKGSMP